MPVPKAARMAHANLEKSAEQRNAAPMNLAWGPGLFGMAHANLGKNAEKLNPVPNLRKKGGFNYWRRFCQALGI